MITVTIAGQPLGFNYAYLNNGTWMLTSGIFHRTKQNMSTKTMLMYKKKFYEKIDKTIKEDRLEITEKIRRGFEIKAQIEHLADELKQINESINKEASFKEGSRTGHLVGGGIKCTVIRRDNITWDQERLREIKTLLPEQFESAFVAEYKPIGKRELFDATIEHDQFGKAVEWARTITPGAPTVKYEAIEEVRDAA